MSSTSSTGTRARTKAHSDRVSAETDVRLAPVFARAPGRSGVYHATYMPLVRSSRLLQFLVSAMVLVALLGCVPGCGASTGLATETSSGSDASGEDAGPGIEEAGSDGADLGDVESASRDGAADAAGDATLSDDGGDAGAHHDADAASSPTLVSISVTPPLETIAQSTTTRLQATGVYSDQSTADLTSSATWSSDSTSVAAVSAGVVTGVGPGTAHVSAALAGVSGQSTITVSAATVQSIAITPAMATTGIGGTVAFSATATLSNQTTQDVTAAAAWSSSTPGIASVSGGTAQGIAAGSVTITATVGTISGTAALQVSGASLTSIALTPTNPVFGANVTFPFAATGTYSDGSVADVTSSSTWLSSAPAAVSLTSGGVATTLAPGTSIVTATIGSIVGQTTVTVTAATLSSIAVAPATSTLALQGTEPLTATGSYSDGSTADLTDSVTWSSSASGTAAVSNAAGSQGTVTAVSAGTASITAALGAVSGSATVTVTPATLLWISITPATPSTPVGTTLQFTATGTYSDGSTLDITTSVAWTTDTATIATISNAAGSQGLATGIGAGTTGVHATLQSATAETTITVTAA